MFQVARSVVDRTFEHFSTCGRGRRECQVLWLSSWHTLNEIDQCVHPMHHSHRYGFSVDDAWLTGLWKSLAATGYGIRAQIHTHPKEAFHSPTDDQFPIVHTVGFLSLVIPDFGTGARTLDTAYLTEIDSTGCWKRVPINARIEVRP